MVSRTRLIIGASFAGSLGWGTVLPFQYAYVVDARAWGATVGVLTGTLFCLGAVVAAPLAGRLTDRWSAGILATVFSLLAAVACIGLGLATGPLGFLAAIAAFGAAVTASGPPTQVLVLDCVEPTSRRAVFAYQFTATALGMAVGAFAAGWMIDLDSPTGMWPAFGAAAGGFVVSAALTFAASGATPCEATDAGRHTDARVTGLSALGTYRHLARHRPVRLLALVSMALAAGFYAQFETGLPAFALQSLSVPASTIGTAAAVNCLVIVGLQWLVVRVTRRHSSAVLLVVVGAVWAVCWLLLELALFTDPSRAAAIFVIAFGLFAVGETMYAPVLSPLAAAVAPPGMLGATLGALSALRTGISAAGPLVAGLLIALDLPHVFVLVHVAINLLAVAIALRLVRVQDAQAQVDTGRTDAVRSSRV